MDRFYVDAYIYLKNKCQLPQQLESYLYAANIEVSNIFQDHFLPVPIYPINIT